MRSLPSAARRSSRAAEVPPRQGSLPALSPHRVPGASFAFVASFAALLSLFGAIFLSGCVGRIDDSSSCARLPGCEISSEICCDATRICEERVCQGVGYICSVDTTGAYAWVDRAAPCDDTDPCTVDDLCVNGRCQGLPKACDNPPPGVCVDTHTLKSFEAPGHCVKGVCQYPAKAVPCGDVCEGGVCTGEPCKGVTCTQPPTSCYRSPGVCTQGQCHYDKLPSGTPCKLSDPCIIHPTCDANGRCSGKLKACTAPHAKGASCVPGTGACQGYACDKGYRDCNHDMDKDGCETAVSTDPDHCGECTTRCRDGAHARAHCRGGKCTLTCDAGWGDCDKDPSNGCERRLGITACDIQGSNTLDGCGVAYCGSGVTTSTMKVVNFGTWYCAFCSHCRKNGDGTYSWCLKSTGKYSGDNCPACCNDSKTNPTCGP